MNAWRERANRTIVAKLEAQAEIMSTVSGWEHMAKELLIANTALTVRIRELEYIDWHKDAFGRNSPIEPTKGEMIAGVMSRGRALDAYGR